jgi:hypothetical protein
MSIRDKHSSTPTKHHGHSAIATTGHGFTAFGHEDIAKRASELWHDRRCPEGSPDQDWFLAVTKLRAHRDGPAMRGEENSDA